MKKFSFYICKLFLLSIFIFTSCDKEISISPQDPDVSNGKLVLNSNPQGAEIFINGDNTGKLTPDSIIHLEPGIYDITMRLYPYLDIIDSAVVEESIPQYRSADFYGDTRNFGNITVNSNPAGAEIFLRDSSLNLTTPAVIENLWPGLYSISCAYPEHRKKLTYVLVRGGESKSTTLTLQDTSVFVDYNQGNSDFPTVQTTCLEIDNENNKWVGLPGSGLVKFRESSVLIYDITNSELPDNNINCIAIDDQNRKWIGTSKGLAIIDNDNWTVYTTQNSDIPHDYITAIAFDSQGNAWIGATDPNIARFLLKFDGTNWTHYPVNNLIVSLAVDNDDRIWVGLNFGFLVFGNDRWQNIVPGLDIEHPLYGRPIVSIAKDIDGRMWVCAGGIGRGFAYIPGGLYVFENDQFQTMNMAEGLFSHVHISPNGNKWVSCLGRYPVSSVDGTRVVLIKIDNQGNITTYRKNSSNIPAGLLMNSASQANGDLWIASREKGIIKFKGADL